MNKGFFISLEGMDGSGKSTLGLRLVDHLRTNTGLEVVAVREPGSTTIGDQIREILHDQRNDNMMPLAEALLFQAARAHIVAQVIRPSLERGAIVMADRYCDSSIAYQAGSRKLDYELIAYLNRLSTGGLTPDVTFLLDLDPEVGLDRIDVGRGVKDRMDSQGVNFYETVRQSYLDLRSADRDGRWVLIDASQSPEEVFKNTRDVVDGKLLSAGLIEGIRISKER